MMNTVVHNHDEINETGYVDRSTATNSHKPIRQKLCRMARNEHIDSSMNWGFAHEGKPTSCI
jgi:hypothetical protein